MSFRIAHFAPSIGVGSGGLGQSIPRLCSALAARGNTVRLHVLDAPPHTSLTGVEVFAHPARAGINPLRSSPSLKSAVRFEASERADVLHVHSLWTMASIYPGQCARRNTCRLFHSPRGTLAEWAMAHHKWRKKVVWNWMQRQALANADCFMVTSEKELEEVRAFGFKQPAAIVHNGIDIPPLNPAPKSPATLRRLLFLGRIHPIKAIDRLLNSWHILHPRFAEWELVVAGSDDGGYLPKMKALAADLNLKRISFFGPVSETQRNALYQSSDLFVLPSHTENFGIVVAEALANAVPVVVSRCAPWKQLESVGCGRWTDTQPGTLAECLAAVMSLTVDARGAMGLRGRDWMQRDFSWQRAAEMTEQTYRWSIHGGIAPEWVR